MKKYLNLAPSPVDCNRFKTMTGAGFMMPKWSTKFKKLYRHSVENIRILMNISENEQLFFLASSGTGGYEALLKNCLQEGEEILVLSNGYFAERIITISNVLGLVSHTLSFDWDKPLPIEEIINKISTEFPRIKAVSIVHLETSTGIINDLETLGTFLKRTNILLLVDAVSSIGSHKVDFKNWGIDGLVTVPNKGLLSPPGISIIALSQKFSERMKAIKNKTYYFDFNKIIKESYHYTCASTVAVHSIEYLDQVVSMMLFQGIESYIAQCKEIADILRKELSYYDYSLFGKEGLSNSITAINISRSSKSYVHFLEKEYALFVGGGAGKLKDHTIRIAHFGNVSLSDVPLLVNTLHKGLCAAEVG